MRVVALIGVPGSGKTSIMQGIVQRFPFGFSWKLLHGRRSDPARFMLGIYRGMYFDGTDQLSFQAASSFRQWLPSIPRDAVVVFEGDRLANEKLFEFCLQHGTLELVLVDTLPDVLERRRSKRAKEVGKAQDPIWLSGRTSKVNRLACAYFGRIQRWSNNTKKELAQNVSKLESLIFSAKEEL